MQINKVSSAAMAAAAAMLFTSGLATVRWRRTPPRCTARE